MQSRDDLLPHDWQGFLSLFENKVDLIQLLSADVVQNAPPDKTVIPSEGFDNETTVASNQTKIDLTNLEACHEEADTWIIIHGMNTDSDTVVVQSRDTDVLIFLIAHFSMMECDTLLLKAGTKMPKFIPVQDVITSNGLPLILQNS